jgi:hypothetical protein
LTNVYVRHLDAGKHNIRRSGCDLSGAVVVPAKRDRNEDAAERLLRSGDQPND